MRFVRHLEKGAEMGVGFGNWGPCAPLLNPSHFDAAMAEPRGRRFQHSRLETLDVQLEYYYFISSAVPSHFFSSSSRFVLYIHVFPTLRSMSFQGDDLNLMDSKYSLSRQPYWEISITRLVLPSSDCYVLCFWLIFIFFPPNWVFSFCFRWFNSWICNWKSGRFLVDSVLHIRFDASGRRRRRDQHHLAAAPIQTPPPPPPELLTG